MKPKVHDKSSLLKLLVDNSDQIHAYGVKKLGLFGSFVKNKDIHKKSDIDFIVDFEKNEKTLDNLVNLGDFLENITGRKVELVTRPGLGKFIKPYILNELENVKLNRRPPTIKLRAGG